METGVTIRRNQYFDSVFLMRINNQISAMDGVSNSAAVMGTDNNKKVLSGLGVKEEELINVSPNDLIIMVSADSFHTLADVFKKLDALFQSDREPKSGLQIKTLEDGLSFKPETNLVVISVPGTYAFREAKHALEKGKNVFLFSNNVSLSDESALKKLAQTRGLLLMGPDCGTSIIGGVGVGFANKVRKGSIGIVGASGTGMQEFTCQVHNAGFGISHAIGTGSHDLSNDIGGITTLAGLKALENDPSTKVIAILSKPPGLSTLDRLNEFIKSCKKPVIGCFLGLHQDFYRQGHNFIPVKNVDEAVASVITALGKTPRVKELKLSGEELELLALEKKKLIPTAKFARGVFAGGTFCYQAQQVFMEAGLNVYSNSPINRENVLPDPDVSKGHSFIDMGDDLYTVDKPHPMIDGTYRSLRILKESRDPLVAALLIDFILGYNASSDPVGDILEAVIEAKNLVEKRGGYLCVAASVCGTDEDFQEKTFQSEMAKKAGMIVFDSSARAALFCAGLVQQL